MMSVVEASPYNLSTDILREYFNNFLNILALSHIELTLEDKNPEVRDIMKEFSEELLVYEVKDRNIWRRSKTDEAGLADLFATNKDKYHLDNPKFKGMVIYAKDEKSLKEAKKLASKGKTIENIILEIRKKINKKEIIVKLEPGVWDKGESKYIDHIIYGGEEPKKQLDYPFFTVVGREITKPETYVEVNTQVEADYQEKLEKDWSAYLKNKYKVHINQATVDFIK